MTDTRPSWDQYFLQLAHTTAKRSTCTRLHVGAVIADPRHRFIAAGYNGSPAGAPHCTAVGCEMKDIGGRPSCIRTIHAEANAILFATAELQNATIYVTVTPCYECAKLIVQSGIRHVVYAQHYESRSTELVLDLFRAANITVEQQALIEEKKL